MQQNLRTIEQSVMRIDRIVLDLMDTVSIEQGRLALSLVPSDLGTLLHSVEKDFSSHPSPGNNQLVLTIQPNLPEISADPERLIQVITNLISNAERHTQNGTITISLSGEPGWQTSASPTPEPACQKKCEKTHSRVMFLQIKITGGTA